MDLLTRELLQELVEQQGAGCVSLFMPTVPAGDQVQQNPIRYKNLLRQAEARLMEQGLNETEAADYLSTAWEIQDDPDFWRHQDQGLAVFLRDDNIRFYRVPVWFDELVVVAERFHIKPLMPLLSGNGEFFILALSLDEVRLLEGTRDGAAQIELEDMPTSLEEALQYDDPEQQNQFHSMGEGRNALGADTGGLTYGHGTVGGEMDKANILRYCQAVNRGLRRYLEGQRRPLVLAGVEYVLDIFREANEYPYVLEETITGNPEQWSDRDLHDRGWEIVEPYFRTLRDRQAALYQQYMGQGQGLASNDLKEVLDAAHDGRIAALFVPAGVQRWGRYDPFNRTLDVHDSMQPDSQDLLDLAAVQTFLTDGLVYAMTDNEFMPDGGDVAAVFRYELPRSEPA